MRFERRSWKGRKEGRKEGEEEAREGGGREVRASVALHCFSFPFLPLLGRGSREGCIPVTGGRRQAGHVSAYVCTEYVHQERLQPAQRESKSLPCPISPSRPSSEAASRRHSLSWPTSPETPYIQTTVVPTQPNPTRPDPNPRHPSVLPSLHPYPPLPPEAPRRPHHPSRTPKPPSLTNSSDPHSPDPHSSPASPAPTDNTAPPPPASGPRSTTPPSPRHPARPETRPNPHCCRSRASASSPRVVGCRRGTSPGRWGSWAGGRRERCRLRMLWCRRRRRRWGGGSAV